MLLGIKSKKTLFWRHFFVGFLAAIFTFVFWQTRPEWTPDMRLWRAVGDSSFILLFLTLILGPLAKFSTLATRFLTWRRELGVWFAVTSLIHGLLILNGWVQWDLVRLMGYEFIPQAGRLVRLEPGFGLANLMGLVALFWALILAATSFDKAVSWLGISSWKWLHMGANTIFYLVALHVIYFMFINYTLSFHRPVPPPNWFRFPSLILVLIVVALQIGAFIKTVMLQRKKSWY